MKNNQSSERPNVLLITVDDMNYNTPGVTGCFVPDATPAIDRLASEGIRFVHSHVNIAVCQPSRSVLMTGRYPHRNGALGFDPISWDVPTLQEQLRKAGYYNGIIGKTSHLAPLPKMCWDFFVRTYTKENRWGRDPDIYYTYTKSFLGRAKDLGRPFFLMANTHDPHRPFAGSQQELEVFEETIPFRRKFSPEEIQIPGFLPDLPLVRKEVAEYFTSAYRADEMVGRTLQALEEEGLAENTLVMFLSDNGMAFPFAKTNCYLTSTRTPWIVRWPGKIEPGRVDTENLISGIDFMPTILDALGLPQVEGMDGRSFLPLLLGKEQEPFTSVFTMFNKTSAKKYFEMRCVQSRRFGYIYNKWSDGQTRFQNESMSGLTYRAMKEAAQRDAAIADRVKLFEYRVKEEFYDFENDPDALDNLIAEPEFQAEIQFFRQQLRTCMKETGDPILPIFESEGPVT